MQGRLAMPGRSKPKRFPEGPAMRRFRAAPISRGAASVFFALALALVAEAQPLERYRPVCAPQQKTAAVPQTQAPGAMPALSVAKFQEEFNRNAGKVRLVAILSPTCPFCRHGQEVVGSLLRQFPTSRLEALIVWLPMLAGDNAAQALAQAEKVRDRRIVEGWDGAQEAGKLFARRLGLNGIAWDVYLLYPAGVKWESALPPKPAFWMHQLSANSGADQRLCLNPSRLEAELRKLLAGSGAIGDPPAARALARAIPGSGPSEAPALAGR
jgi:hypothetical protein